jgi:hypothetical protein
MTNLSPETQYDQLSMKLTPNEILEQIASVLNSFNPCDDRGDLVEEIHDIMDQHCPEMMNSAELEALPND